MSTSQQVAGIDANGKPIKTNVQSVNKTVVPNPRAEQAKGNEEQLKIYNAQLDELRNDKKNIDKTVREDFSKRPTDSSKNWKRHWLLCLKVRYLSLSTLYYLCS